MRVVTSVRLVREVIFVRVVLAVRVVRVERGPLLPGTSGGKGIENPAARNRPAMFLLGGFASELGDTTTVEYRGEDSAGSDPPFPPAVL